MHEKRRACRASMWSFDQEHMAELPLLLSQPAAVRLLREEEETVEGSRATLTGTGEKIDRINKERKWKKRIVIKLKAPC